MWYRVALWGHFDDPPIQRFYVPVLTTGPGWLIRTRQIISYNSGTPTDSGWSDWSKATPETWLLGGYGIRSGASWTKTECLIEVAPNIGRPWQFQWVDKITASGVETYTAPQSQTFLPGDTASYTYDAADGKRVDFGGAVLLLPYGY